MYVFWQVREDEISELEFHLTENCPLHVKGGVENNYGKINILLQTFISKGFVDSFSLVSDLGYVAQVNYKPFEKRRSLVNSFYKHELSIASLQSLKRTPHSVTQCVTQYA